jgi:phosphotransferase system enzyme I (PtsP)
MLVTLRQIVREVSAATHLDVVLDIIVHRVKEALSIDACAVYLSDVDNNQYVLMAADGFHQASIGEVRIDRQEGLLGLVGERRELMTVTDAATHPRYLPSTATGEEHYQSFLGVPLIHYHQVLGVLVAWKRAPDQFTKDEVIFFITIATQLAKAVHQAAEVDEVASMLSGEKQGEAFIQGMQMAAGLAIGTAVLPDPLAELESIPDRRTQDIAAEEISFRSAVAAVHEELRVGCPRADPRRQLGSRGLAGHHYRTRKGLRANGRPLSTQGGGRYPHDSPACASSSPDRSQSVKAVPAAVHPGG